MIIFSPRLENYQFSQPRWIFLIYGNTIYVFSIYGLLGTMIHEYTLIPPLPEHVSTKTDGLTNSYTILHLTHQTYTAVENIVRKGEIACNKQFLHFSQCFSTMYDTYFPF